MSHPLERKLGVLRGRLRRLVLVCAISWVIAAVLAAVVLLGLVDYVIRFQDRGLRVICSLAVLGVAGWACYRHFYLPLPIRLRDVDLAMRLQRHFAGLEDRLLSAVEFLGQTEDDPLAGSLALRRAVIAETTAATEPLDFADVLDARQPLRAAIVAAAMLLVAATLVLLDPSAARIAAARLVNPFGSVAWPQETRLLLHKPVLRVARGQAFELEVSAAAGTKLPPEVRIHYRFEGDDGAVTEEREPMRRVGTVVAARRDNVVRPFAYRVEGGDDQSMPWIDVEVVTPPAIESLSIRLIPPAYSGWPAESSERQIRALVGTRIEMAAQSNKPLESAELCLEGGRRVPGRLSDDGRRLVVPAAGAESVLVDKSGSYWFELVDREGLSGGSEARWEIRAVPDSPPSVAIEAPTENLFVTTRAVVPLRVAAKDDLAIRQIALVFNRSDRPQAEGVVVPLYTGPEQVEPSSSAALAADAAERRVVTYRWELERLELPRGVQVTFYATAGDYLPQMGTSDVRRLVVITPEELQQRLASRQSLILAELDRVLKMQRACRAQVQGLEIRLAETGRLEQLDVDHLEAAELNQRQVNRGLTDRGDGIPMHVLALLADLENNRVDSPDVQRRVEALLGEIGRLERQNLTAIGRDLTAAVKAAQIRLQDATDAATSAATIATPLGAAGKSQDEVIVSLERMLGQLARWDNYRRFYRDIAQLLHDQEEAARATDEVGRRTLTKAMKDLAPQEIAELKVLSAGQFERGRRLDRVLQEMAQAAADLRQNDPLAAETVGDALDEAGRLGTSGQLRSCAEQLAGNQIGQAVARQKQIVQDLRDVLDILANRRQFELTRLVKKLQEAEADLEETERQQVALRKRAEEQPPVFDQADRKAQLQRLSRDQEQLQQDTQRLARRLERLQAERAGRTAHEAAGQMGQSAESAGRGDPQGASKQSDAAAKTLEEARRQLAAQRLQAQAELATEQMARLEDAIKHLHRQQQGAIEETQRFEGLRRAAGQLTRAQAMGLADLARLQRSLQAETATMSERLAGAGAFQLALAGAASSMDEAAGLLDQRQTGAATQDIQQQALAQLELLLEALRPDSPASSPRGGGGGAGQGGAPPQAVRALAELKLLKLLQQQINLATQRLQEAAGGGGKLSDAQRGQYLRLGEEQGRLAEIMLEFLQAERQNPEDNAGNLPDAGPAQGPPQQSPPAEEMP